LSSAPYDVVIVGAGPAGSNAAHNLAASGHRVAVLEQKSAPGQDVCCTGIVSTECFDSFGLSSEVILYRASSVVAYSPSRRSIHLRSDRVQAYVLDRDRFDKALAAKAQRRGVEYRCNCRVTDISIEKDRAAVTVGYNGSREVLNARAVVLASGRSSRLLRRLGFGEKQGSVAGAQLEVETDGISEIEIYVNQDISPGFFSWIVPIAADRALVGLLASSRAGSCLASFLASPGCRSRIKQRLSGIQQKVIPLRPLPRTYGERMLVIGDAAGHVKPITGGGIYFGHIGASIAVRVLDEALRRDDLTAARLSRYQHEWRAKLGREMRLGAWARRSFARLSNGQIEKTFDMIETLGLAPVLVNSPVFSFDWHGRVIAAGLKSSLTYPLRKIWNSG
jgi:digeranylgeranylglycerophospholipid reductase